MIRNIVFDIGNVLIDFDWGEYIYDLFDTATAEAVRSAMFCELWNEIDRGVLTEEELLQSFINRAGGFEKEIRHAYFEVGRALRKRGYAIPWIKGLKAEGYNIYYLSNFSEHVKRSSADALSFIQYTNGGIFSYDVKVIKPDPAIYKLLFDKYSLIPSECVFIDDNPANIEAAKKLGMHTVHFTSFEQAKSELNKKISLPQ